MASLVPNNPYDMQPKTSGGTTSNMNTGANINSAAPAQYNPTAGMQAQTYNPQTSQVNRTTDTVAGQVDSMLANDSPLLQRARTLALQGMNQRGLVNSSMAQGAGVAAMIDRITPIAQQDANTYNTRTLANQDATNTAGMFNVGENNKLVSQGMGIAAGYGMQKDQQGFASSQSALDRSLQESLQKSQQTFQASQSALERAQQLEVLAKQQGFQASQSELDRANQIMLADKNITAQQALQQAQQEFQGSQASLDRQQQLTVLAQQQGFQADQATLDRAQQIMLADKNISAQQALQLAQQEFQKGESALDRTQQLKVLAEQQGFQANQATLDRAQQIMLADKNITAQQALQVAQQEFQGKQAALDRTQQRDLQIAQQTFQADQATLDRAQQIMLSDKSISAQAALQKAQQEFQGSQATLDRAQQRDLQLAQQTFQGSQAELDRAAQIMLADKNITAQKALQMAQQEFQGQQASLDRKQQLSVLAKQQGFQASQATLDRAQQIMLADKQITAQQALQQAQQEFQKGEASLDRAQQKELSQIQIQAQKELQTAQQNFQSAQAQLDRAQQVALADKSVAAQQSLQEAQQNFQAAQAALDRTQQKDIQVLQQDFQQKLQTNQQTFQSLQAQLDRDQQTSLVKLQDSLNSKNVSASYAVNVSTSTLNSINTIMADPNLTPDAKKGAIQNVIDSANSAMQWGATFYNTTLPTISAPAGGQQATRETLVDAYRQILGREPDDAGLNAYLSSGKSIGQIRSELQASDEGRAAGRGYQAPQVVTPGEGAGAGGRQSAMAPTASEIASIYQSAFGRAPDQEGLAYWMNSGLSLDEIRNQIGRSDEAVRRASGLIGGAMG